MYLEMWPVKQDLIIKTVLEYFMKLGLKEGISIDADSGPHGYVLWCSAQVVEVFPFFQIGYGHTADWHLI